MWLFKKPSLSALVEETELGAVVKMNGTTFFFPNEDTYINRMKTVERSRDTFYENELKNEDSGSLVDSFVIGTSGGILIGGVLLMLFAFGMFSEHMIISLFLGTPGIVLSLMGAYTLLKVYQDKRPLRLMKKCEEKNDFSGACELSREYA